ncbi:enoyl-CoA hydratase-related protein [Streptomyces sp. INA 01156]
MSACCACGRRSGRSTTARARHRGRPRRRRGHGTGAGGLVRHGRGRRGARFGLPEIQVGAMGGAKHASRLVPQALVRRMHFTGDMVPVEELVRYGGIDSVVPAERLLTAAGELARRIVRHSPVAIRTAKRSLNRIEYMELKEGYTYEQSLTGELSAHDDAKEAVRAFFERREPRYTGK